MSNEDLAITLGCTVKYVKRIRRQQLKTQVVQPELPKGNHVELPKGQVEINFAAKAKAPSNPIKLNSVLLSMGYKRNTEEWYVAWMVLRYGSIRGAQEGVSKVAERLHKIVSTAEVLGRVAA
jgi:hypothetical protein